MPAGRWPGRPSRRTRSAPTPKPAPTTPGGSGSADLRRRSVDQLLGLALGSGAVLTAPIALVSSVWTLAAFRVVQALLSAGATTLAYARAGRQLPAGRGALGYALLTSGSMLGAAFAPMLVGVLAGLSLPLVFVVNTLLYGLGCLILLRARLERSNPTPDEKLEAR